MNMVLLDFNAGIMEVVISVRWKAAGILYIAQSQNQMNMVLPELNVGNMEVVLAAWFKGAGMPQRAQ